MLEQAKHNIRVVEVGKSVHNIQFADKLLIAAYNLMKNSLSVIEVQTKLQTFSSDSEIIPNECYNCHSGIQEINKQKFGMNFSHNQHIVKERIACQKCHSNEQKHGELILNKETCNSCHHSQGKSNDACAKCHSFQSQVYQGQYQNKNQADFMKEGGVGCIDCHVASDKVTKPDNKICLKCHEAGYDQSMTDWKKEFQASLADLNSLISTASKMQLSNEDMNDVNDAKKIVNQLGSYPSIYVHNYDMLTSVINDKKKKLKNIIK